MSNRESPDYMWWMIPWPDGTTQSSVVSTYRRNAAAFAKARGDAKKAEMVSEEIERVWSEIKKTVEEDETKTNLKLVRSAPENAGRYSLGNILIADEQAGKPTEPNIREV